MFLKRPVTRVVSPSRMNRKARTMDGPAPTASVYIPHMAHMLKDLMICAFCVFPSTDSTLKMIPYMIPRCRPERARMCEAPLDRNASVIWSGMSDLSPIINAFTIAFVSGLLKPIESIVLLMS